MRIVHVMASRVNGGVEIYSTDMMESLHREGIAQALVVPRRSIHRDKLMAAGARVESEVLDVPLTAVRRWRMARLIAEFAPDLVHCWTRRSVGMAPRTTVPIVGWLGNHHNPGHFAKCSHLIGVSEAIVRHLMAKGVASTRAHYVPNFTIIDAVEPVARGSLDTPDDAIVLLALSRLHERKGLDVLLRALVALPGCVAWLAGDGPFEGALRTLARKLGVADRTRFLGWRTDRGALLRAADICVLPSRTSEGFPAVILEAWAAATPLVATAVKGPGELIETGVNGLLTPIGDPAALAAAIRRVASEPELRRRLIAGGSAEYRAHYTREAVTRRMLALYRQLIDEHRRQAAPHEAIQG